MSNPNSTVARWRNAKWALVEEENFGSDEDAARDYAEVRRMVPGNKVRVTSFKLGPKTSPMTHWMVRVYRAED